MLPDQSVFDACREDSFRKLAAVSFQVEHHNVDEKMLHDNGRGIILADSVEPIYGTQYLPRKFKIGVTVPGDNSLDIYTNDIGCVVIVDDDGELLGFNVMVGGGMGRTHNKENTFARAADHMGFVPKEDITEVLKAILAAQRDHGNRDVRANARMKYLVHTLGIEKFTRLVESYTGKEIAPWAPMADWKYADWMGWWEQGDGKLFYGQHVDNGRVKDEGDFRLKSAIRAVMDKYNLHAIMSPTQSIIFRDIDPKDREGIDAIFREHGVAPIEEVDPNARLSMACPALPLCGLAQGEAERIMPSFIERMRVLLDKMNLPGYANCPCFSMAPCLRRPQSHHTPLSSSDFFWSQRGDPHAHHGLSKRVRAAVHGGAGVRGRRRQDLPAVARRESRVDADSVPICVQDEPRQDRRGYRANFGHVYSAENGIRGFRRLHLPGGQRGDREVFGDVRAWIGNGVVVRESRVREYLARCDHIKLIIKWDTSEATRPVIHRPEFYPCRHCTAHALF